MAHALAVSSLKTYMHPMQKVTDVFGTRPSDAERPTIVGPITTAKTEGGPTDNAGIGHFTRWKHLRRANFASPGEIVAHLSALRRE
jgi:hypothetical protein